MLMFRLRCLPEGYAPQVLPRKDRACVQRLQAGRRRCRQQARQGKDPPQEDLRPYRAREALPVQEGFLGPSPRQRSKEEGTEGHWKDCCVQEVSVHSISF